MNMQGPNVKKLITTRMAQLAIPKGGDVLDGFNFLTSPNLIKDAARKATEWVDEAIAVVKTAPDNPFGSDEEIAGAILARFETRDEKVKP